MSRLRLEALRALARRDPIRARAVYSATVTQIDRRRAATVSPSVLIERLDTSRAQLDAQSREAQNLLDRERLHLEVTDYLERTLQHDMANPISVLVTAKDLSWHAEKAIIIAATDQLRSLARELLDLEAAATRPRTLAAIPLGPIVARGEQIARALGRPKRIAIDMEMQPPVRAATVAADETMLDRCVTNLVSNAIKFTPVSGMVGIRVSDHSGFVQLSVWDSGPGFSSSDLHRAGKRLGSLSAKPTGGEESNGLGLFATRQMCESQGIELTIANRTEGGAVSTLRIRHKEPTA